MKKRAQQSKYKKIYICINKKEKICIKTNNKNKNKNKIK